MVTFRRRHSRESRVESVASQSGRSSLGRQARSLSRRTKGQMDVRTDCRLLACSLLRLVGWLVGWLVGRSFVRSEGGKEVGGRYLTAMLTDSLASLFLAWLLVAAAVADRKAGKLRAASANRPAERWLRWLMRSDSRAVDRWVTNPHSTERPSNRVFRSRLSCSKRWCAATLLDSLSGSSFGSPLLSASDMISEAAGRRG